jgi:signal transduction histidine kinase
VNSELIPTTEYSSAEEKRAKLRDIYGDILNLIQPTDPKIQTDIGFHFYEGLAKLVRKMQGAMWHPLHQLWAAAEELRFLFDAHAVWLSVPEEHRQAPSDVVPGEIIWDLATLTEEEKKLLVPVRDGVFTRELKRREAPGMRWDVLDRPLGEYPEVAPNNSNLASVDSVLVIDVAGNSGTPWQLAVFMEHHPPRRETTRDSTRFCEAILPTATGTTQSDTLRRTLARIGLPFGPVHSLERDDPNFWTVDRQGFQKESDQFRDRPIKFCELYQERFQSIHTILERIYDQMDTLLAGERQMRGAETTLVFSYRAPNEDFICFFPTARQALSFVQTKDDIADFLSFWQFQYPRSKAISGWVLATGTCDYTEKFDSDGRWNKWISRCSAEERPGIERQLALVRKFFKTEQGQEQKFMYLVPIVLRPGNGEVRAKTGFPQLQPILMASIGSSKPLARPLRRQLYDLAWQIAPAVEMALFGQMTLEQVYRKEAELRTVARFSGGIAHEIRQPLNMLAANIASLQLTTEALKVDAGLKESLREDLDQADQCVDEIKDIEDTMRNYVRLRQGSGCRIEELHVNEEMDGLVSRFRSWLEVMRRGNIQVNVNLAPEVGILHADRSQFRTMIRNLLRNADDALLGQGSGQIQVFTRRADMSVEVVVTDNGPGMKQSVVEQIIERLTRGETYTTKSLGIGLGLTLIYLSCKEHGGSFDIRSQEGVGTSVVLRLPISETTETTTV